MKFSRRGGYCLLCLPAPLPAANLGMMQEDPHFLGTSRRKMHIVLLETLYERRHSGISFRAPGSLRKRDRHAMERALLMPRPLWIGGGVIPKIIRTGFLTNATSYVYIHRATCLSRAWA